VALPHVVPLAGGLVIEASGARGQCRRRILGVQAAAGLAAPAIPATTKL